MNLLLLEEADFVAADRVVLADRRFTHMQEIHRVTVGDSLRVGRVNGLMGKAEVVRLEHHEAELQVAFDQPPPAKLPLTLVLAVPRPKMLRRLFQTVATLGVPRLILVNSYKVEKSFWQTPFLNPRAFARTSSSGSSRPATPCCPRSSSRSASSRSSRTACPPSPPAPSAWSDIPAPTSLAHEPLKAR